VIVQKQSQQGVYLVVAAVLLVTLLGFGALVLDLGRLFVLRSQMQNAADAAALAAAAELGRDAGAQTRAEAAARDVLEYDSNFAEISELLGANISLEFYCAIGSEYDVDPDNVDEFSKFCPTDDVVNGRYYRVAIGNDLQSHYVRVTMDQENEDDAYSIPLFFLPVLNIFGLSVDSQSFLQATAVAGRNYLYCEPAPMLICNPFEDNSPAAAFRDEMEPGEQIILASQGQNSSWAPGNFSFLTFGGSGAGVAAAYLADPSSGNCTTPVVTTETGQMSQLTEGAINTRFDIYEGPPPFRVQDNAMDNYPPAPDVIDYPDDLNYRPENIGSTDSRFGLGDWDKDSYWEAFHGWKSPPPLKPFLDNTSEYTRYQMYQWEIDEGHVPQRNPDIALTGNGNNRACRRVSTGELLAPWLCEGPVSGLPDDAPSPWGEPERRIIYAAVANCEARGLTGNETFVLFGRQEGFAKLFLTKQASQPGGGGGGRIWAEYIDWGEPGADSNIRVDVQLYE